jgi:integrase
VIIHRCTWGLKRSTCVTCMSDTVRLATSHIHLSSMYHPPPSGSPSKGPCAWTSTLQRVSAASGCRDTLGRVPLTRKPVVTPLWAPLAHQCRVYPFVGTTSTAAGHLMMGTSHATTGTTTTLPARPATPALAAAGASASSAACKRWRSRCDKCGVQVPQGADAALCDAVDCPYLLCMTCFPDLAQELWCPAHQGGMLLSTQRGTVAVTPAVETQQAPPLPLGASPVLAVMFTAIVTLLAAAAASAVQNLERSWRFFNIFLRFINVPLSEVTEWIVCSYILCRVCPPISMELPAFMAKHVAPSTAYGDILALRRRARMSGYIGLLVELTGERVSELLRRLTAGVKKSKTNKAPILIHHIRSLWASGTRTVGFIRDVTLLLVALLAGLRRREIVALTVQDVHWNGRELAITVRRDKVNFNLIGAQCPRTVVVAHALLDEVWPLFAATFLRAGTPGDAPLFRRCVGSTITTDGIAPDTVRTIIRERLPGLPVSPHSLRVGCATELHAAGVPIEQIMEIGRWGSLAALLYVLPSADAMARATRSMGNGGVQFDRVVLQRTLQTDAKAPRVRRTA